MNTINSTGNNRNTINNTSNNKKKNTYRVYIYTIQYHEYKTIQWIQCKVIQMQKTKAKNNAKNQSKKQCKKRMQKKNAKN